MPERKEGLLEWLLHQSGGSYMSDMRYGVRSVTTTNRVCRALQAVYAEDWTVEQWADAAGYLTDVHRPFYSQRECVQWLLGYLEKT